MKVIHCLNNFLPQQVAGTEVYTEALVKELLQKNIDALVLIPNYGKTKNETYWHENIRVIQYAEPSVVNRALIMGRIIPEGLIHFKKIIEEEKPSVVHFHIAGGSNGISLHHVHAVKQSGIKIIMTFHLVGYTCKTNNLLYKNKQPCNGFIDTNRCTMCIYTDMKMGVIKKNILYAAALTARVFHYNTTYWNNKYGTAIGYPFLIEQLKKNLMLLSGDCDKIVVLTHWYKKVLEDNGVPPHKLVHIAQGLPRQQTNEMELPKGDILKLVFVGRINESKGLHLLIKALKQLPLQQVSLDIYGKLNDETYANECRSATTTMKNINWMGVLPPEKVVKTLSNYHCLCLPSVICEMSPLIIQEAFAAGIPVIASDVYGNAEQIKNGDNGWLFKFNDSNDLKNKLKELIENPEKILIAKKNIPAVKSFSAVADEYEQLYKDLEMQEINRLSRN